MLDKRLMGMFFAVGLVSVLETSADELHYKELALKSLIQAVPSILKTYDSATGRFGTGVWICTDQNVIYPLAAAWAIESEENPYYHDAELLKAIIAGGNALIEDAGPDGSWVFRKKDNSTWGTIRMPWTYSRWIRTFSLIKDAMPPADRERWEKALILGYSNIMGRDMNRVHNIPAHHAMGLYCAGETLGRPEWCEFAKQFMARVVAEQDPTGYWTEHSGPVVRYNLVYVDALGHYYAMSHDQAVLHALKRAARFHMLFTYPDGSLVETIDERNPYHKDLRLGNVGFTYTPEGRWYLARQIDLMAKAGMKIGADDAASLLLYGEEGLIAPITDSQADRLDVTPDGKALVRRKGPWFICLSAYHCPISESRWIQDRQNLVSIFHDSVGLIVGGGNTKLQPLWSTFTVGDVSALSHKPGDENPRFTPAGELYHVPDAAGIRQEDPVGLGLFYSNERCSVLVDPLNNENLRIILSAQMKSGLPVEAHLTLIPHLGERFAAADGFETKLGDTTFELTASAESNWIEHAGWKLTIPKGARVKWPVLPHNPYRKDGRAEISEGRIVITIPFSPERKSYELVLSVGNCAH
ncbi:MAG: hypothetical protein QHI38_08775 [Armatimonadota bacterium]|nr:hypothetical protein [Armatimonadota bacterium]